MQNIPRYKLTAGDKCAFTNMIFAKTEEGWTPSTKMLAVTYLDLSEKFGCAFAGQWYLEFRTGLSKRTMSRSNKTIHESGLFELKYLPDDSLEIVPYLERFSAEYKKYQNEEHQIKEDRRDKMSGVQRQNVGGTTDKMSGDHGQNGGHNLSTKSLHPNPSTYHSADHAYAGREIARFEDGRVVSGELSANRNWPRDAFDRFMQDYPAYQPYGEERETETYDAAEDRRVAKIHFDRLRKSGNVGFELLMKAVHRYAARTTQSGLCPCKPASFLTRKRWEDEPLAPEQTRPANDDQEQPMPAVIANDNRRSPELKVSGVGWDNDPPF